MPKPYVEKILEFTLTRVTKEGYKCLYLAPRLKLQKRSGECESLSGSSLIPYQLVLTTPELIGNGYRITVDGGGVKNPRVNSIFIQIYEDKK